MLKATTISRPVIQRLHKQEFAGRVLSIHRAACNLVGGERDVITLLAPFAGHGPFSIVIDTAFDGLSVGDPVHADARRLVVGDMTVKLDGAAIWEPQPEWSRLRATRERVAVGFRALDAWPSSADGGGLAHITGADQYAASEPTFMSRLARGKEAYSRLIAEGLGEGKRDSLTEGAKLLAGLGPGGTPAGDDFLVGAMAAIWLLGDETVPPILADTAAPRTAALSAAFLRAAGRGEFIASWHALLEALAAGDTDRVEKAAKGVESFGASSGADALDGFTLAGRCLLASDTTYRQLENLSTKETKEHERPDRRNH